MAPTTKIDQSQPGTLPADFGEWDGGNTPVTLPDNFDGFDAAPSTALIEKSPSQTAKARTSGWKPVDQLSKPNLPVPSLSFVPIESKNVVLPVKPTTDEPEDRPGEDKRKKRTKVMMITVGLLLILLISVSLIYRKNRPEPMMTEPSAATQPQQQQLPVKPSVANPVQLPAQIVTQDTKPSGPVSRVELQAMSNQLNAPTRISRNITGNIEQEAPALSGSVIEGMGGNSGDVLTGVFKGKGGPAVKAESRTFNISAGVAEGLLLKKTLPTYPSIAKASRVSGTVVLKATISKTGAIEDLHVVDGSKMLRQSALDAVKAWHYKPYLLNNQPVEVETTVNVVFSLGN